MAAKAVARLTRGMRRKADIEGLETRSGRPAPIRLPGVGEPEHALLRTRHRRGLELLHTKRCRRVGIWPSDLESDDVAARGALERGLVQRDQVLASSLHLDVLSRRTRKRRGCAPGSSGTGATEHADHRLGCERSGSRHPLRQHGFRPAAAGCKRNDAMTANRACLPSRSRLSLRPP